MPAVPRRVVTGHDERGVSVFTADGPVPVVRTALDGEVVLVLDDSETVLRSAATSPAACCTTP